ncbi:MAG: 2OG-Fe(II) oxygenase [Alphaproteobacteria bacterium]|nr:2OG-Fe(II) oxygenase [Alphaproteobacteria bacterium]
MAGDFMASLAAAEHVRDPYDYWLLDGALSDDACDAIANLPFAPPGGAVFDGRRESNNSTRVYFTPENQARFPICRAATQAFGNADVIKAMEQATGADLSRGALRIEYCQDIDGFWLEPHLDISVKLLTMLIYLSDDPQLADAGTDVYDATPHHNKVATSPYGKGKGLIFIPGKNTWHGFSKRPIRGLRKSIIINFVSPEWQNRQELAYA